MRLAPSIIEAHINIKRELDTKSRCGLDRNSCARS